MSIPISVVVLTYNEAMNIGRCLDSVQWSDDVVVLDSHSDDSTCDIAREKGARVEFRVFDDYAKQRNHALKEIAYKHDWVLMLDADEVVPDALGDEMAAAIRQADGDVTLFRVRRRDFFMGTWLKHSSNYSSVWFGRLMRVGRVWVERAINEEYHTDGKVESLTGALDHYPFNKGIGEWVAKHNRYSSMEAELRFQGGKGQASLKELGGLDAVGRRKWLKKAIYGMPGFPLVMFVLRYFFCGGILDGRAGFMYCLLKTYYEYLISCKTRELARRNQGLPV